MYPVTKHLEEWHEVSGGWGDQGARIYVLILQTLMICVMFKSMLKHANTRTPIMKNNCPHSQNHAILIY